MTASIHKCVFPVAGKGTRFLPVTKVLPKELLPVIDKPLLQFGVEEAYAASIEEMIMVISEEKRAIEDYFCKDHTSYTNKQKLSLSELNELMEHCEFKFPLQPESLGLGHAISCASADIGAEDFAVLLPDDLCSSNTLRQMMSLYRQYQCCVIAVERVGQDDIDRYGIIDIDDKPLENGVYRVHSMVEKPKKEIAPSNLGVIGRYILMNEVLEILATVQPAVNGEIQLTSALNTLAQQGQVIAYELPSQRFDCGTAAGLVEAIKSYSRFN